MFVHQQEIRKSTVEQSQQEPPVAFHEIDVD